MLAGQAQGPIYVIGRLKRSCTHTPPPASECCTLSVPRLALPQGKGALSLDALMSLDLRKRQAMACLLAFVLGSRIHNARPVVSALALSSNASSLA